MQRFDWEFAWLNIKVLFTQLESEFSETYGW